MDAKFAITDNCRRYRSLGLRFVRVKMLIHSHFEIKINSHFQVVHVCRLEHVVISST
jgi:hypothetical protein